MNEKIINETIKQVNKKIPILTLCGSQKFKKRFREVEIQMTLKQCLVISLNIWNKTTMAKSMLNEIHNEKIRISDIVGIVCPNNYIGNSTSREMKLAIELNKPILFFK